MDHTPSAEPALEKFGGVYFDRYLKRNLIGMPAGNRPSLYAFWERYVCRLAKPGMRILEVGCGLGFLTSRLARRFSVVGVDISLEALSFGRHRWRLASTIQGDAESLPCQSERFDIIIAFDVIEHLPHPEAFLAEASRVLVAGGVLILTTPNPNSLGARVKGDGSGRNGEWIWFGARDQTHVNIKSIGDWRRTFADNGLRIIRDGTDFLWDAPYFGGVPVFLQRLAFIGTQWIGAWLVGFLPWHLGENYVAIVRKE